MSSTQNTSFWNPSRPATAARPQAPAARPAGASGTVRAGVGTVSGTVRAGGDRVELRGQRQAASPRNGLMEALDFASGIVAPGPTLARRAAELVGVRTGLINPPNDTRLGAYEATQGHARGTVGRGANNSIGAIYMLFGTFGQDRIGNVFHGQEAQSTLRHSVNSEANGRLARTEYGYWRNQLETQGTAGGAMGSAFVPRVREGIQTVMSNF